MEGYLAYTLDFITSEGEEYCLAILDHLQLPMSSIHQCRWFYTKGLINLSSSLLGEFLSYNFSLSYFLKGLLEMGTYHGLVVETHLCVNFWTRKSLARKRYLKIKQEQLNTKIYLWKTLHLRMKNPSTPRTFCLLNNNKSLDTKIEP